MSEPNSGTTSEQHITSDISTTLEPIQMTPIHLPTRLLAMHYDGHSVFDTDPTALRPLSPNRNPQTGSVAHSDQANGNSRSLWSVGLLNQLPSLGNTHSAMNPVDSSSVHNTITSQHESREPYSLRNLWPGGQQDYSLVPFSRPERILQMRTQALSIHSPPAVDFSHSVSSVLDLIPSSGFGGGFNSGTIVPLAKTESSLEPGEVRSVSTPVIHHHQPFVFGDIEPVSYI